jgi:rhamnosyltransferase
MTTPGINILLACYNGEKFIGEQIESILNQTYKNWLLYIRDDNSTDNTEKIIREYERENSRIHFVRDEKGNLGSCQNFSLLINAVKNENKYVMFCDQDDVWLPNKIENTIKAMLDLESRNGENCPLLVYTNFTYVDQLLKPIKAKMKFNATKISNLSFSHILAQNPIYGCTMMINKRLVELVGTIPIEAENHDYWIALVASAFGKILRLDKRLIFYRQHSNNISTNFDNSSFLKRFKRIVIQKKNFQDFRAKLKMSLAFKKLYYLQLSNSQKVVIDDFIAFSKNKSLLLLLKNIKNGLRRQTFNQTILFYCSILFSKKTNFNY